jgi:hypothetical protein
MADMHRQEIDLMNLFINIENPRFEMVGNQRDAINIMLEDQRDKLIKLAEDIVDNGLNPSELIIVTPHETDDSRFVVMEGNRRITALKLLSTPELIPEKYKSMLKRFKQLRDSFLRHPIEKVPSVIFDNVEQAYRWIKLN